MEQKTNVGIVGMGIYLPKKRMTAAEMAAATGGNWTEEAITNKLGVIEKCMPSNEPCDGTQEMGALAALDCLKNTGVDPMTIDVILCMTEEWKEYPLTTSACYVQDRIGAWNAWAVDIQNRCCTCVTAMKMAKDLIIADEEVNTVLICGGYRNCDMIDLTDSDVSFMFNLAAGGGAMLVQRNYGKNLILGSHLISDGSVCHTVGGFIGGLANPINGENYKENLMLRVMDIKKLKGLLNQKALPNWFKCIDEALRKSGNLTRADIGYLANLHTKRTAHLGVLEELGLSEDQTVYLDHYGHIGQVDQILSLMLAQEQGKLKDGDYALLLTGGIGYLWGAAIVRWG